MRRPLLKEMVMNLDLVMLLGNKLFNKILLALGRGLRMLLLGCALGAMSMVIMPMPVRWGPGGQNFRWENFQGGNGQDLSEYVAPLCATQVLVQAFFCIPDRPSETNAR
jgi:hypothetical protein